MKSFLLVLVGLLAMVAVAMAVSGAQRATSQCVSDLAVAIDRARTVEAKWKDCRYTDLVQATAEADAMGDAAREIHRPLLACEHKLHDCNAQDGHPVPSIRKGEEVAVNKPQARNAEIDEKGQYEYNEEDLSEAECQALMARHKRREAQYKRALDDCKEELAATNAATELLDQLRGEYLARNASCERVLEKCLAGDKKVRITVRNEGGREANWLGPFGFRFTNAPFENLFDLGSAVCGDVAMVALFSDFSGFQETGRDCRFRHDKKGAPIEALNIVVEGPYNNGEFVEHGFPGLFAPRGFPLAGPDNNEASEIVEVPFNRQGVTHFLASFMPSEDAFVASGETGIHPFSQLSAAHKSVEYKVETVFDAGMVGNDEVLARFFANTRPLDFEASPPENYASVHPGYFGSLHGPTETNKVILGGRSFLGVRFDDVNADFTRRSHVLATVTFELLPWHVEAGEY